jgi:hypothetical protein
MLTPSTQARGSPEEARMPVSPIHPLVAVLPGAEAGVALSLVSGDLARPVRSGPVRKQDNDRHLGP